MKHLLFCFLVVAPALAVDWANVKPLRRVVPIHQRPSLSGRIIGGGVAVPGQFPYQVGIYLDEVHFCGGSLISDTVVLTAGHCVADYSTFDVHLGATNISDSSEAGHQVVRSVDKVLHETYDPVTIAGDVGLVRLPAPVSGNNIATIRLPARSQQGQTFEGSAARASGWGKVSDESTVVSQELRFADVTVIGNAECELAFPGYIFPSNICIDTSGGTQGVCNGDSGGPLTITEADGQLTEVGIASFVSDDGCQANSPAGFTRVTSYLDWIESNAGVVIRP